jgi:hypothetical protein
MLPEQTETQSVWLTRAKEAYEKSTSFVDNNYRKKWENNIRRFQSRHDIGSKYYKEAYKYRSKVFRPKTRSAIRNNEAAAVAALFSNQEVVCIEPINPMDKVQEAAAAFKQSLLEHRLLSDGNIPWFVICVGAIQDAMVTGAICSYQNWIYEERTAKETVVEVDPDTGEVSESEVETVKVVKDHPFIEIMPVENVRIDPNAKWYDPINTSPYVILLHPMYVGDAKKRMEQQGGNKQIPKWKKLDDEQIKAAREQKWDSTRITREHPREDRTTVQHSKHLSDFDIVWVHQNIMEIDGADYVYWTLGTEHLLTDPIPIEEIYWTGKRPIVMGTAIIETHKIYPSSLAELGNVTQKEINEIANARLDNVKFVLNKRWFVKRGSGVDLLSITRNVPGGITMMEDPQKDVVGQEFRDVTGSSYMEQDRLNLDFDELVGTFSASTINSNRRMNETVGGMSMLRANVNVLTEYLIRTFSESWLEPVLKQLVEIEEQYETDEQVLLAAAQKAQLSEKYGIPLDVEAFVQLLQVPVNVTVNIGMGATDPIFRMRNFSAAIEIVLKVLTGTPPGTLNVIEIIKEVFGFLGFKDGSRFLINQLGEDPEKVQLAQLVQQLQAINAQLQQVIETKEQEARTKLAMEQMKEAGQDRRKAAELRTNIALKELDLLNPVAGENPPAAARYGE